MLLDHASNTASVVCASEVWFQDSLAGQGSCSSVEGGDEQDVGTVYGALHSCLSKVPRDLQRRVTHIAVCGQMHGAVCWAAGRAWTRNSRAQLEVAVQRFTRRHSVVWR